MYVHIHANMCSPADSVRLAGRQQHSKSPCSNKQLWIDNLCTEPTLHTRFRPCSSQALVQAVPQEDARFSLACWGGGLLPFLALLQSHQEFKVLPIVPSLSTHSSKLPISVTVSLLWDSCSSSFSDSESCRDNLVLFRLPARRMLEREPPFFTRKLRVPLIWSKREPPILIFLLGTVLKE